MPMPDWNERYATDNLPWDTGQPAPHLVELIERGVVTAGRVLEIGCGTGTNALWLAARGFDVLGVDISTRAIARAEAKPAAAGAKIEFRVLDFLSAEIDRAPFEFVFDRGVLHMFDDAAIRAEFARRVVRVLADGGHWLSLAGSTEGPDRDEGPPRRSASELVSAVEPALEILELRSTQFDIETPVKAWQLLSRVR